MSEYASAKPPTSRTDPAPSDGAWKNHGSLIFDDTADEKDVEAHVLDSLTAQGAGRAIMECVEADERSSSLDLIANESQGAFKVVKVVRVAETEHREARQVEYNLYLPPITNSPEWWGYLRRTIRNVDFGHPTFGAGAWAPRRQCRGCHGHDHDRAWCPMPRVEGWFL